MKSHHSNSGGGLASLVAKDHRRSRRSLASRWRQGRGSNVPEWFDGPIVPEYPAHIVGSLDGMLSEYVMLNEDAVLRVPDQLSFEEGATLPCAAVTAWNALTGARRLHARLAIRPLCPAPLGLSAGRISNHTHLQSAA
jgi:threonine dehydrogenase-like Zn-dependent dehydrogenase